jgi:RimJ/RimL family protein N-acetyltransferase
MSDETFFHPVFERFPTLETQRLRLRQLRMADAEDVFRLFSDNEVTRYYDLETFEEVAEAEKLIYRQLGLFWQKVGCAGQLRLKGKIKSSGRSGWSLRRRTGRGVWDMI